MRTLIRLLVFAAGGTAGGFLVLLFLSLTSPNGLNLTGAVIGLNTPLAFPASLLAGTTLGALAWLGVTIGHARWTYLAHRPGHTLYRMPVAITLVVVYLLFGVTLGVLGATSASAAPPSWLSALLLIVALPVGVPLGYGYLSGFGERPPAAFSAFVGVIYGALAGFWLALVASITVLVSRPATSSPAMHFVFSPVSIFIILSLTLTTLGFGVGIVTGCAEGIGLWLCPPTPTNSDRSAP